MSIPSAQPEEGLIIITFSSIKGGTGKTTLSVYAAAELARRGMKVAFIDLDPQSSGVIHMSKFPPMANLESHDFSALTSPASRKALMKSIERVASGCQVVIIDTPGNVHQDGAQAAMLAADLIIVPLRASSYDVQATQDMIGVLKGVRQLKPDTVARLVLNCFSPRQRDSATLAGFVESGLKVPALKTRVGEFVAMREFASGEVAKFLWESRKGAPAADAISAMVDDMIDSMNQGEGNLNQEGEI